MEFVWILTGLLAGTLIGYLAASRKSGILRAQMEMQQAHDLELLQSEQLRTSRQAEEITSLQQSLAVARTEKKALEEQPESRNRKHAQATEPGIRKHSQQNLPAENRNFQSAEHGTAEHAPETF